MAYAATTNSSSNAATTAPHRKNAAHRSNSPYQQRTTERENPAQQLIKQAVDFLLKQLEEGKSEALTAYLGAMARFHNYSFATFSPSRGSAPQRPASPVSALGTSLAALSRKARKAFRFLPPSLAIGAGRTSRTQTRIRKRNPPLC